MGGGDWMFFKDFRGGGQGCFANSKGVPFFGFYCIFINKFSEIFQRGVLFHTPPSPPPCVHLWCSSI